MAASAKTTAKPAKKAAPAAKKAAPAKKATPAKKAPVKKAPAKKATPAAKKAAPVKKAPATATATARDKASVATPRKVAPAKKAPAAKKAAPVKKAPAAKKAAPAKATARDKMSVPTPREVAPAKKAPAAKKAAPVKKAPVKKVAPAKKTLVVREDESPWTAKELSAVTTELHADHTRLLEEIANAEAGLADLIRDSGDGAGDDQADAGSKTFEREHEMSLANNARDMLDQVQHALHRIEHGTYGICESCGRAIGKLRLQAFPRATLCMSCKQAEERY